MRRGSRFWIFLIVSILALASEAEEPLSYSRFIEFPYAEREKRIRELSPPDQIEAYLLMVDETEPPNLELADRLAPGGRPLADATVARIERDENEWHRADLVSLLWTMHAEGTVDARSDPRILAAIERARVETRSERWKQSIARKLDDMRTLASGWAKVRRKEREEEARRGGQLQTTPSSP